MDTFLLNTSICNKCFTLKYRGKQPYLLTQCAHIYCQDCWQKAEKHCTLCGNNDVLTVELGEQLPPKVKPLFEPLAETLKTCFFDILRVDEFRNNQLKIVMHYLIELEKKYNVIKNRHWTMAQDMKMLTIKYMRLKKDAFEKDKLEKLSAQIQQNSSRRESSTIQTPLNSRIFIHPSSSGYSSESMGMQSVGIMPVSIDPKKQRKIINDFRVPNKRKDIHESMMSMNSYDTDLSSKILFRR
ncbi:probable E3 SUMO-protein ligase RNF212 [Odontomachus brunneus]|uniref:probable E3 SUMO-protein ligase RNF212 n=1 Tax=Odontomachus brunneus TaxID=486640 RepID=UPI0013F25156|nr:probable E3 SUMO-protein ligase RNF212 [Odontomachus brunneus]XP_032671765.1 probable E3 SUMO-protein ligase RNF212 [Odontomachus brunneus]XP_032671766.1 probable E3 SUMO-protein ligase RNF212 [Odontomachus brunneus]